MKPEELGARLGAPLARDRAVALDELSDRLEHGKPAREEVARALALVSELLAREQDREVLESALHALATAATSGFGRLVPLAEVARTDRWERDRQFLEYALIVLGACGEKSRRELVRSYLTHAEPSIREEARRALEELDA